MNTWNKKVDHGFVFFHVQETMRNNGLVTNNSKSTENDEKGDGRTDIGNIYDDIFESILVCRCFNTNRHRSHRFGNVFRYTANFSGI